MSDYLVVLLIGFVGGTLRLCRLDLHLTGIVWKRMHRALQIGGTFEALVVARLVLAAKVLDPS